MQATEERLKKFAHVEDMKRRTYLAMTEGLDAAVGVVLDKLRTAGLEKRTLVFFLSDNGGPVGKFAENGSHNGPLRGSKGDTWEGGIRVPFLVQWPDRLPAGKRFDHPVIALDILPTALAAAGVDAKAEWKLDGLDLLPHLEGKKTGPPHEALYWRFGRQMAVRAGDWKLVRPDRALKGEYGDIATEPMLFNLADDVGEKNDLAAKHPERVKELQAQWDRWNAGLADPRWPATVRGKPVPMKP
jgi:arylsulfatase A-like enzyme